MRRILGIVLMATAMAGCSGFGGNDDSFSGSQFQGRWLGTIFVGNRPGESMNLSIGSDGTISGSETVNGSRATINGTVDNSGRFDMTSRLSGTSDVIYTGTMRLDSQRRLNGTGTGSDGTRTMSIEFNLRQN